MNTVMLYRTDFDEEKMPWADFLDTAGYDTVNIKNDDDLPESVTLAVVVTEANGVKV